MSQHRFGSVQFVSVRFHLPTYRFFPRASMSEDGCGLKSSESSQDSW